MKKKKDNRGGKRKGAGRKKLAPTKTVSFRVKEEDIEDDIRFYNMPLKQVVVVETPSGPSTDRTSQPIPKDTENEIEAFEETPEVHKEVVSKPVNPKINDSFMEKK